MSDHEYIIDLEGIGTEEDLHERLRESLPLPDYYGDNLDALYDVLTESADRWNVIITNRDLADDDIRPYIDDMIEVFEDASAVAPDLTVELEDDEEEEEEYGDYSDED